MPSSIVSRLQRSSSTVPRDERAIRQSGDDQALEEDLHLEDLLLERLCLERHLRELVEVRIALGERRPPRSRAGHAVWRASSCTIVV